MTTLKNLRNDWTNSFPAVNSTFAMGGLRAPQKVLRLLLVASGRGNNLRTLVDVIILKDNLIFYELGERIAS
jgi:hypothetical protein